MRKGMEIRRSVDAEHEIQGDTLVGYAALFDTPSPIYGGIEERIHRSTFSKTVQEQTGRNGIAIVRDHDPSLLLGRHGADGARVSVDSRGLHYEVKLGAGPTANDVRDLVERGVLNGSSFAGTHVVPPEIDRSDENVVRVTVREVALRDVGPVTFPYYPDTTSEMRALSDEMAIARSVDPDVLWARVQTVGLARAIVEPIEEAETATTPVARRRKFAHLL